MPWPTIIATTMATRRIAWLVSLLVLIGLSVAMGLRYWTGTEKLRIAAGTQGSVVYRLGTAVAETMNVHVPGLRIRVVEGESKRNSLQTLLNGEAELAVAFSDSEGDGNVRTLVPLYELYLYMIVWEDGGITDVPGFRGRRVGVGPAGSGTDLVARRLMGHYAFEEGEVTVLNDSHRTISKAFLKHEIDAVCILGSIESKAVERMLKAPGAKLLSLDDPERVAPVMDGIRTKQPFVVSHVIPKHLFGGKPDTPTGVIGVHALLVASAELSESAARDLTRAVFENKLELGGKVRRLRELSEEFDPNKLRFPLHPGAAQYYRRDEPPAILEWADTISLFITVVLIGWSGVLAVTAHRRRARKGILDDLYADFSNVVHTYDEEHETPP
ncbi:MAG: TAXI family TRAP transporter solute-binding subunit, partial [Deltaproteobacteria bacterium]|nr:TAXI family TRAP transporter solute-binding subunit [Deltaproteobacteria bacterium]